MNAKQARLLTLAVSAALLCTWFGLANSSVECEDPATTLLAESPAPAGSEAAAPATRVALVRPGEVSDGCYSAPVGACFSFSGRVQARTTMRRNADGFARTIRHDVGGALQVLVVARRQDEMVLRVGWVDCRAKLACDGAAFPREASEALQRDLRRAALVRMRDDGTILGYRFDAKLQIENRNWVRLTLAALRQVLPAGCEEESAWETDEPDDQGTARFGYRWLDGAAAAPRRLARERLEHARAAIPAGGGRSGRGSGVAGFDFELGFVRNAEWADSRKMEIAEFETVVEQELSAAFALASHRIVHDLRDVDWEGPWLGADARADLEQLSQASRDAHFRRLAQETSLDQVLQKIAQLVADGQVNSSDMANTHELLAFMLGQDEGLVDRIGQSIRAAGMDAGSQQTRAVLLSAISRAGTEAAQALLRGLIADNEQEDVRSAAALAIFSLERPSGQTLRMVRERLAAGSLPGAERGSDLLMAGALAGNPQEDTDSAAALRSTLVGMEQQSKEQGRLSTWLHALGNSGDPELIGRARPYLQHEDPRLRRAAAQTLGRLSARGDRATSALLLERIAAEKDPRVRAALGVALAESPGAAARARAIDCMLRDKSAHVRGAVLRALGPAAGRRHVADSIRQVAQRDPDADLRRIAGRILRG